MSRGCGYTRSVVLIMATIGWTQFFEEISKLFDEIGRRHCCEFLPVIQDLLCRLEYTAKNVLEIKERVETLLLEENDDDIDSCNYLNIHLDKLLSYLLKDARKS